MERIFRCQKSIYILRILFMKFCLTKYPNSYLFVYFFQEIFQYKLHDFFGEKEDVEKIASDNFGKTSLKEKELVVLGTEAAQLHITEANIHCEDYYSHYHYLTGIFNFFDFPIFLSFHNHTISSALSLKIKMIRLSICLITHFLNKVNPVGGFRQ